MTEAIVPEELRSLLDALPEPVVLHERGRILAVNATFAKLLDLDADYLVGRHALENVHPDDKEFVLGRLANMAKNRRTPEHRIIDRHGTAIPIEVTGIPFPFDGRVVALAIVHDLRERKRVAAEFAAADRLASLGRIASAVGHEINNPLTYVLGSLDLLRRELVATLGDHAPHLTRVDAALEGAGRVRNIVRDLAALSRPDDDTVHAVDLERALDRAIATTMHEIEHRARLVRDGGGVAFVAASEGRLVQVFVNLLVNAAHAIPDGDAATNEIRVVTRMADATHASVEVIDTGAGLPPGDRSRLFEPFVTTKAGSGTGLGLSIAHRIVSSFGGTIVAEPRKPRGTCFRVTLPLHPGPADPEQALRPSTLCARRARILFVDDEPLLLGLVAEGLAPHEVVTAGSGRRAIDLLEREHFDAVVCDLQMPDLGGVDVYEWITARRPELCSRIVFTTGGAFTQRAHRFIANAPRPVVEKPFDFDAVRRLVEAMLEQS